jgi:hypothetical protein
LDASHLCVDEGVRIDRDGHSAQRERGSNHFTTQRNAGTVMALASRRFRVWYRSGGGDMKVQSIVGDGSVAAAAILGAAETVAG